METRHLPMLVGACALALMGCTPSTYGPSPEQSAADAAGLDQAIVFYAEGLPTGGGGSVPATLSLETAVRMAVSNDPGIQAALSRVRIAEAEADQARLLPNPIVSVAFRYPEGGGQPIIDAGITAAVGAILQRGPASGAADKRVGGATAAAVSAVLDVVAEVDERYASIQALDAMSEVLSERRKSIERFLDIARERNQVGEGSLLDVLTAEGKRLALESESADRDLERRQERIRLAQILGRPADDPSWTLVRWEPPREFPLDESHWIATALAHRPEVLQKRWELAARESERPLGWRSLLGESELGADSERDGEWSVGPSVSLPLPLFDFGQARRARAAASVSEARHELTQAERAAVADARQALADLTASRANLGRVRSELVPIARRRLEQANAQYSSGMSDVTSILLAEEDLREALGRQIELERRVSLALAKLHRVVGGRGTVLAAEQRPNQ